MKPLDLIITRGLPASGKTTWAKAELASESARKKRTIRVSKDDLRAMLYNERTEGSAREGFITAVEIALVGNALAAGHSVIVDDTNLDTVDSWKAYAEEKAEQLSRRINVTVQDFTNVQIWQCVQRDRARKDSVGRGVIERMALKYKLMDLSGLEKVAIVDIDNTIADMKHRLHYIDVPEGTPKNYDAFYAEVCNDAPILSIIDAVIDLSMAGHTIINVSGRRTSSGRATDDWLAGNGVPSDYLFMRRDGDRRPDEQVKRQIYDEMIAAGLRKDAIKIVLDDRDSVCAVWRDLGLPLIQVKDGAAIEVQASTLHMLRDYCIPVNINA
jgi:predicted kinase